MTPKEKADELIEKFLNQPIHFPYIDTVDKQCIGSGYMTYYSAVKCAIIAVDEIIYQWDYVDTYLANLGGEFNPNLRYWQEVKTELKLKN